MNTKVSIERTELASELHDGLQNLPASGRFTAEQLEVIYALGYTYFTQGQYEQALPVFTFLSQYGATRKHYLYGLALCLQMLNRPDEAISIYSLCATLFPDDFAATMRIAECEIAAGRRDDAVKTLGMLLRYANTAVDQALSERAEALLKLISRDAAA